MAPSRGNHRDLESLKMVFEEEKNSGQAVDNSDFRDLAIFHNRMMTQGLFSWGVKHRVTCIQPLLHAYTTHIIGVP